MALYRRRNKEAYDGRSIGCKMIHDWTTFAVPKIDNAYLTPINHEEKTWIDSLAHPFSSHHTNGGYEVFMLQGHHHPDFNPFCHMIFYVQHTHVGERETPATTRGNRIYYIH